MTPAVGLFVGGTSYPDYPQDANVEAVLSGIAGERRRQGCSTAHCAALQPLRAPHRRSRRPLRRTLHLALHLGLAADRAAPAPPRRRSAPDDGSALGPHGPRRPRHDVGGDGGRRAPAAARTTDASVTGRTSLAHGWSTAPTYALSAYVLGMRPTSPGWRTWTVEPQPIGLRFASGSVGTPYGSLGVGWRRVGVGCR